VLCELNLLSNSKDCRAGVSHGENGNKNDNDDEDEDEDDEM